MSMHWHLAYAENSAKLAASVSFMSGPLRISMLLRTRFYIPPLKESHLLRPQLIDRLNCSRGGELILVSAPAGYGKTTLVSQWLHTQPQSFAWLILDHTQRSAEVFWRYVIGALQTIASDIGQQALQLLQQDTIDSVDQAVVSLLNDLDRLDIAQDTAHAHTLVMDDFHKVENSELLPSLSLFLDHLPPSLRLVITSRDEPNLSLARRRSNHQLIEFNVHDLAFSNQECLALFRQSLNYDISSDTAKQLTLATEGWITGLQLSAMSMDLDHLDHLNSAASLNRNTSDYLFEEVFSRQPQALQSFLVATASVPKFCPALANQLQQTEQSYHFIQTIEKTNLFLVALDNHNIWYRYHDLFRQFLLTHFSTLPKAEQNRLLHIAAGWFEEAGHHELALEHYLQLKDWTKAKRLMFDILDEKLQQGQQDLVESLIMQFPATEQSELRSAQSCLEPTPAGEVRSATSLSSDDLVEPLTRRESEVMGLVREGLNNKEIAREMNISLNTLKVHIRNLYGKMGVENRSQAISKLSSR